MAPATESVMGSLPREKAGVGSAVNDTTRQVGGALGVAIIGSVVASVYSAHIADAAPAVGLDGAALDYGQGLARRRPAGRRRRSAPSRRSSSTTPRTAFVDGPALAACASVPRVVILAAAAIAYRFLPAHAHADAARAPARRRPPRRTELCACRRRLSRPSPVATSHRGPRPATRRPRRPSHPRRHPGAGRLGRPRRAHDGRRRRPGRRQQGHDLPAVVLEGGARPRRVDGVLQRRGASPTRAASRAIWSPTLGGLRDKVSKGRWPGCCPRWWRRRTSTTSSPTVYRQFVAQRRRRTVVALERAVGRGELPPASTSTSSRISCPVRSSTGR